MFSAVKNSFGSFLEGKANMASFYYNRDFKPPDKDEYRFVEAFLCSSHPAAVGPLLVSQSTQGSSFPPASFSLSPPASRVLLPFTSTCRGANTSTFLSAIISSSNYIQIYLTGRNTLPSPWIKKDHFGFTYLRSVPAAFTHYKGRCLETSV